MATLFGIAMDMRRQLSRGPVTRELSGGLALRLERAEAPWPPPTERYSAGRGTKLTLSRPAVPPSEMEISICRQSFGVPETAERVDVHNEVILTWTD